ncbi:hypothetical protein ACFOMD_15660 [Sphingoaurantiacus capsulatus]|uniref:Aspartate-semialdehyde dehydrogenase n=1 Tax=Sphingoaurantiacus capsulatus TaxID=1771310 RepID=A0ABV7XFZ1_9SPHN
MSPDAVADRLLDRARDQDFAGYDPFDGLNSRLFNALPLIRRWPLARLAWLQAFKRSPVNFRPLVGVPRRRNPKGVALFMLGMVEQWRRTGDAALLAEARELADWLLDVRVDRTIWRHSGWGYHFDWQARAFHVLEGTPNAITTCYVAGALRTLAAASGEGCYAEVADDAALFLDGTLGRYDGDGFFYGYIPGDPTFVHNANLWVAARVAEGAAATGDARLAERALAAARRSAAMQAADGSWIYGTRPHHRFIDGFHTGYNLEALRRLQTALGVDLFEPAIDTGYAYYKAAFIDADGAVRYYAGQRWPEETHSAAQALVTLALLGDAADLALADKVRRRMIETLYDARRGAFHYQRSRWLTNRVDYSRWSQAWAFYALSFLRRREALAHG